jgi:glycosyltransferase involved in cell wall biosynthesis
VSDPKVSVVIPTFNRSAFLQQAITSVLAQTYLDFEIIISDNASTDDTAAIVGGFPDERIRYFRNDRNVGMGPNWNVGLRRARGAYVVLLEDDNWWCPEYLTRAVGTLDQHPDIAFVHTAVYLTDAHGTVIRIFKRWRSDRICHKRAELTDLIQGNKIFLSSVTARRSVVESIGMFDERIPYAPDWDLWLHMYTYHDGAYVADPLLFYRQHEANVTRQFLARPSAMFEDHRYTVEKTLQRIGEVYGVSFARQLRKLSSRWLIRGRADMEFWRAWETYLRGEFEQARQEASLALECDRRVILRFPLRLLLIALSKYRSHGSGRSIATIEGRLGRWLARNLPSVFRTFL